MADTIDVPGSYDSDEVKELVRHMTKAIAGREPDKYGFSERYWAAFAHSMFSDIFRAFLIKSSGGTDELGDSWEDLKIRTKAYNRPDARIGLRLFDNRAVHTPSLWVRPTLDPAANKKWAGFWVSNFLFYSLNKSGKNEFSKRLSAKFAWGYFKSRGYPTLLGLTSDLTLPILNKTGTLQRSLFPAPLSRGVYFPIDPNQVYKHAGGRLTIGTKVPYADYVSMKRKIWPDDTSVWESRASTNARNAIFEYFPEVMRRL